MNLPKAFCERMKTMLGSEYDSFIRSYDTTINQGIRINPLKCKNKDAVLTNLGITNPVPWCPDGYYTTKEKISGNHPYHAAGIFYFQEPSAMSAACALPLCDNPHILDLCAAPGGKTTHIAARMNNKGLLVSNEIIEKRARILSENVERMGLTNTIVTNETPPQLAQRFSEFFDGIIVDAPCSGEGMFRKEPQAADEWSVEHVESCAIRQKNILDDAYKMLKSGGYIIYSTCTFSFDENEGVVQYMVEKYGMEICDMPCLSMLSPGLGDFPYIEKCRRVFPHLHMGEGHFMALLKKKDETSEAKQSEKKDKHRVKTNSELDYAIKLYRDFESKALNVTLSGEFILFGDTLYLMPEKINTDKLRIIRCGLQLGVVKKNRFEPSHALSHALPSDNFKNCISFNSNSEELKKYMHGDIISCDMQGWCIVLADTAPVGWGKASSGQLKNHYPKGLRILA